MGESNSNIRFVLLIFAGITIGFLLAFLIFNSQYTGQKWQVGSSDKKYALLQSKNAENCTNLVVEEYLKSQTLNESNLSEVEEIYKNETNISKVDVRAGLLSPRIYSGILQPRSFLITNFDPLREGIKSYLQEQNTSASVYIENLRNGANMGINEDEGYFPASLNKLPVAILILQKIEDGKLSMNSMLTINDNDKTDSYGTLYLTKEKQLPVRILLEKMLKESDNTAFNVLFGNVDRIELERLLNYYNLKENIEYPFKRLEYESSTNLVAPIQMYNIFSSLYLSTVLYAQDSEYVLSLLSNTDFDIKRLANLPDNVTVAHKFGEYYLDDTKLFHDCGIMYIGQSRIFYCIMMKGIEVENAKEFIGYLVDYIYNYVIDTRIKYGAFRLPSNDTK